VFAGMRAIVNNLAGVDYHFYKPTVKKNGAKGWVIDEGNPWEKLLRRPNKFMSWYDFKKYHFLALEMTGKSFWLIEKNSLGEPTELNLLPPHLTKPVPGKEELIAGFEYEPTPGRKISYKYEDVLYFRSINSLDSLIDGLPGITAAKDSIMTDLFATAWNKVFFKNASKIDGILFVDGPLNDDQRKRNLEAWDTLYKGMDKAHKIALIGGGTGGKSRFQDFSRNLKDMDFIQLSKMKREEVLGVLGVPAFVVGIREDANYANADAQMRVFWELGLSAKVKEFESTMTMRVGDLMKKQDVVFQADLSTVKALQENELQRAQTAQAYRFIGIPLNDIINKMDLPFDPVEDKPEPEPEEPPAGTDQPEDEPKDDQEETPAGEDETPKAGRVRISKQAEELAETVKRMRWNAFDRNLRMHEPKFEAAMKTFFKSQRARVLARLKKVDLLKGGRLGDRKDLQEDAVSIIIQTIWNDDSEMAAMQRAAGKLIRGVYADFALQAIKDNELDLNFSLKDPELVRFVESKVLKLAREASATTKESLSDSVVEAVRDAIAEGLENSETMRSIADRIDDVYDFAQAHRSTVIARTEVIGAANTAGYDMLGRVGASVQWLTSRDGKVRDTHQLLEGDVKPHGEPFITAGGAKLQYPGDPSGPPEEIIQCRCTIIKAKEQ
jgi:HK97 family phage portal protein